LAVVDRCNEDEDENNPYNESNGETSTTVTRFTAFIITITIVAVEGTEDCNCPDNNQQDPAAIVALRRVISAAIALTYNGRLSLHGCRFLFDIEWTGHCLI
jgi:hypothetical protein